MDDNRHGRGGDHDNFTLLLTVGYSPFISFVSLTNVHRFLPDRINVILDCSIFFHVTTWWLRRLSCSWQSFCFVSDQKMHLL